MIALDASTAVQPFRDMVYDIAELGAKLQELIDGAGYVTARYADGSAVAVPSASLVHIMVPNFARLIVSGELVLSIRDGALAITAPNGPGALEAAISEHLAGVAEITRSHIVELTVSGNLFVDDLSSWAESRSLKDKTVSATRVSGVSTASALLVRGAAGTPLNVFASGDLTADKATLRGEWAEDPKYTAYGLVTPNTVNFEDDATRGTVKIQLTSGTMSLVVPSRTASAVTMTIRCEIPYYTPAGWEYLEADSYNVDRGDASHIEAAKGAMTKFLIWPRWKMEGMVVSGGAYPTRVFRVYPGTMEGEAPIVRVENLTDGTITVPRVWQFLKNSNGKGSIYVAASAQLRPHSCKEFEFRHNGPANCGYMCPLSGW